MQVAGKANFMQSTGVKPTFVIMNNEKPQQSFSFLIYKILQGFLVQKWKQKLLKKIRHLAALKKKDHLFMQTNQFHKKNAGLESNVNK